MNGNAMPLRSDEKSHSLWILTPLAILMGVVANYPLALATGLGLNAFVTFGMFDGFGDIFEARRGDRPTRAGRPPGWLQRDRSVQPGPVRPGPRSSSPRC